MIALRLTIVKPRGSFQYLIFSRATPRTKAFAERVLVYVRHIDSKPYLLITCLGTYSNSAPAPDSGEGNMDEHMTLLQKIFKTNVGICAESEAPGHTTIGGGLNVMMMISMRAFAAKSRNLTNERLSIWTAQL
jgi:hypothetical protein